MLAEVAEDTLQDEDSGMNVRILGVSSQRVHGNIRQIYRHPRRGPQLALLLLLLFKVKT